MSNTVLTQQETHNLLLTRQEKLSHRKYHRGKKGMKYRGKWDIYAYILKHTLEHPLSGAKRSRRYGSYLDGGYGITKKWLAAMQELGLMEVEIIPTYTRSKAKLIYHLRSLDNSIDTIHYPLKVYRVTDKGKNFLEIYEKLARLLMQE